MKRRSFLKLGGAAAAALVAGCDTSMDNLSISGGEKELFKISLAQWSLHKRLYGQEEPKLDNLDFAATARKYDIEAVEYVNQFFKDKARDENYLAEMKKRASDNGVKSLLIMCDGEGNLGDPDAAKRKQPFCLSVSFKAPHNPQSPDSDFDDVYADTVWDEPENYDEKGGYSVAVFCYRLWFLTSHSLFFQSRQPYHLNTISNPQPWEAFPTSSPST